VTHAAELVFSYPEAQRAVRVEHSLRPEVGDVDGDRTMVTLARDGAALTVAIEARDLVALRAAINTWTTLASVAERAGLVGDP
jgi:KEOPS complex subunit Pcc1